MRRLAPAATFLLACTLAACGGGSTPSTPPTASTTSASSTSASGGAADSTPSVSGTTSPSSGGLEEQAAVPRADAARIEADLRSAMKSAGEGAVVAVVLDRRPRYAPSGDRLEVTATALAASGGRRVERAVVDGSAPAAPKYPSYIKGPAARSADAYPVADLARRIASVDCPGQRQTARVVAWATVGDGIVTAGGCGYLSSDDQVVTIGDHRVPRDVDPMSPAGVEEILYEAQHTSPGGRVTQIVLHSGLSANPLTSWSFEPRPDPYGTYCLLTDQVIRQNMFGAHASPGSDCSNLGKYATTTPPAGRPDGGVPFAVSSVRAQDVVDALAVARDDRRVDPRTARRVTIEAHAGKTFLVVTPRDYTLDKVAIPLGAAAGGPVA